ncbi:hypothetical protein AMECASPLE_029653 [Ameca splendens]|uniref:Uncharacterized protein n=1 Tax=Ameca splendens TaxID=208324 RepID=A0ABV0Z4A0_9TELE
MPMWFRKLAEAEATSVIQSAAEPPRVRNRWAEPQNPLTICSSFSPSPSRSQEEQREEEEEDFQPQSLDSLLRDDEGEEEEVLQTVGQNSTFILRPDCSATFSDGDFRVEGVTDPVPEVRGQGAEPMWRTHQSPDSACSEGSTGSLEQQQDTDTETLSQGSSVGSLGPEEDEDRNSLKNHFESLASTLSEERFDTDLTALQPAEEKPFLNPRLSISTRFLSRFQDRLRVRPGRAPVSFSGRISEESSRTVKSEPSCTVESAGSTRAETGDGVRGKAVVHRRASCGISHQPQRRPPRRRHTVLVLQCRKTLGDITSRTQTANSSTESPVPQDESRLTYLDISMSSKPGLIPPVSSQEENKENLSSASDPQPPPSPLQSDDPDLLSRKTLKPQEQGSSLQVLATPTLMSQCGESRWSISSLEETPRNPNRTLIQSPAPSAPLSGRKVKDLAVQKTRFQTDPVKYVQDKIKYD